MKIKGLLCTSFTLLFTLGVVVFSNTNASIANAYPIGGVDYNTTSRVYDTTAHPNSKNNAIIWINDIPDIMEPGQTYEAKIGVFNNGQTTWTPSDGYYLGYVHDTNPFATGTINFGTSRIYLNSAVYPGEVKFINFKMTAPTEPGVYYANLQFLKQFDEWFGTALGKAVTVKKIVSQPGNSAEILSDTIPDVVIPNEIGWASVTVKNTGDTTWKAFSTSSKTYYLGAAQDDNPFAFKLFNSTRIHLTSNVAPGKTTTIWFLIKTPAKPGIYTSKWQMVHNSNQWFGPTLAKSVTVKSIDQILPTAPKLASSPN